MRRRHLISSRNKQLKELGKIHRQGSKEAAKVADRIRLDALRAVRAGRQIDPDEIGRRIVKELTPILADAGTVAAIAGLKREYLEAGIKHNPTGALSLSTFDSALSSLEVAYGEQFATIAQEMQIQALTLAENVAAATVLKLQVAVFESVAAGSHVAEGTKALNLAFRAAGIVPRNSFTTEALFRTQTQTAYSAGRWQADQDPAVQEILWGYEYSTVGDDRVRDSHAALDGLRLPKDDPRWSSIMPPNGYACRCLVVSIFDSGTAKEPTPKQLDDAGITSITQAADDGFAFNPGSLLTA